MPGQEVRSHTPRLHQPEQRHLDREQRRLRVHRPVQQLRAVRPRTSPPAAAGPAARRTARTPRPTPRANTGNARTVRAPSRPLRALPGEQERQPAPPPRGPRDHARRRARRRPARPGPASSSSRRSRPATARRRVVDALPASEPPRPTGAHAARVRHVRAAPPAAPQPRAPGRARPVGACRPTAPRARRDAVRRAGSGRSAAAGSGACFEDDVGVGAADAEGRDAGAARAAPVSGQAAWLGQQARPRPRDQSTCGDGSSTCRVLRQHPVPQGQHHLDDAGHARGGLRVADVGLDRAQQQRPVRGRGPGRRWRAAPAPRSGRRASCRCRAPRPRRRRRRAGPALASAWRMTRCCDGPFGAVRPLLAPSWLTAEPRTTASTWWP